MSNIEWTDRVWNPVVGCSHAAAGCLNCYAERMTNRLAHNPKTHDYHGLVDDRGKFTGHVRCLPERLADPLGWRKPGRCFVNSMSDLFHPSVPFEFIDAVFGVMALAHRTTFQVLTKRPARMAQWSARVAVNPAQLLGDALVVVGRFDDGAWSRVGNYVNGWSAFRNAEDDGNPLDGTVRRWPLPNVWLGASASTQRDMELCSLHLPYVPAAVRFLSVEPLLEALYLGLDNARWADWVIVGGESGPGARPCDVTWVRGIVHQCRDARVPVFVKQLGSRWACDMTRNGDRNGRDMDEWPHDLRVRQFPDGED